MYQWLIGRGEEHELQDLRYNSCLLLIFSVTIISLIFAFDEDLELLTTSNEFIFFNEKKKKLISFLDTPGFEPGTAVLEHCLGNCAIFNRIYFLVICIIIRFEVCANSNLQTHMISADYSVVGVK